MKTKIDGFSGFLGAGKSILIKKLINEKLYNENIAIHSPYIRRRKFNFRISQKIF